MTIGNSTASAAITNGVRYSYPDGSTYAAVTGDVTALGTDRIIEVTPGAAVTVTLPALNSAVVGFEFLVIDAGANAGTYNITIVDDAAATVATINTNGGCARILARPSAWRAYHVVGNTSGERVATVADANVVGGVEVVHIVAVPDGTTGDVDVVLTYKTEVTRIEVIKTAGDGGASDTITVKNSTNAITNAMDINVVDKTVVRPTTIDDARTVIAAAGTLRVTRTKASAANVACRVLVYGVRRA